MKVGDKITIIDEKAIKEFVKESCDRRLISTSFSENIVLPDSITGTIIDYSDSDDYPYHVQLDDFSLIFKYKIEDGYFRENELQVI